MACGIHSQAEAAEFLAHAKEALGHADQQARKPLAPTKHCAKGKS